MRPIAAASGRGDPAKPDVSPLQKRRVSGPKSASLRLQGHHKNTCIWVNYNDLTATSLESWLIREIIPTWP